MKAHTRALYYRCKLTGTCFKIRSHGDGVTNGKAAIECFRSKLCSTYGTSRRRNLEQIILPNLELDFVRTRPQSRTSTWDASISQSFVIVGNRFVRMSQSMNFGWKISLDELFGGGIMGMLPLVRRAVDKSTICGRWSTFLAGFASGEIIFKSLRDIIFCMDNS